MFLPWNDEKKKKIREKPDKVNYLLWKQDTNIKMKRTCVYHLLIWQHFP